MAPCPGNEEGRDDEGLNAPSPSSERRDPLLAVDTSEMVCRPEPCPPSIRGQIVDARLQNQLTLCYLPPDGLPQVNISDLSDLQLADHLCQWRAVFPFQCCDDDVTMVECLVPLRKVANPYPFKQEYIIIRPLSGDAAPLSTMQMALVRDCLMGNGRDSLQDACSRPNWTVTRSEYYTGHCFLDSGTSEAPGWKLQAGCSTGQMKLTGLVQYISQHRRSDVPRPTTVLHPWQADPPLPATITIDVSNHHPRNLPAPDGWEIMQRNGRVWIAERRNQVARMDAAQYGMLLAACVGRETHCVPSTHFLENVCKSCRAQQDADQSHCVPWSRHLLARIQKITGAELLIGASAVNYNPHFLHFSSPHPIDEFLGSVCEWPQLPALLILDSFAPPLRRQILEKAADHRQEMWVLRRHVNGLEEQNLTTLRQVAQLYAELPKKSMVLHRDGYWESAAWDVDSSRFTSQLWKLNIRSAEMQQDPTLCPEVVQQHLSQVEHLRYAFHWREGPIPPRLLLHRQHQQDALRYGWAGLIAGTDGSVDERTERMGAGYVVGTDPEPIMTFHARVGGPLASTRAEAASLLQLLGDVRQRYNHRAHLLIFVDCLVVLDILRKWGRGDFHPGPKEIVHFAVIRPLLDELRKWDGSVTLVKVKSHTGCLLNERADEQAELGRSDDGPEICPGPQKYGSFWLRVRPAVREYAAECGKPLPRDSAPNRSLLEKVATSNTLRAIKKRSTHFVTDLLHHKTGTIVSRTIRRCRPAEYRVWLRCMTGIYPVQTYLARIRVAKSPLCPHCTEAVPETLTHFACVCPKFREARTSAHNQVRTVITSFLASTLGPEWTGFEETPMAQTGLTLRPTPLATVEQLGRRQPDWVLVSEGLKKIAIVDLNRPSDVHPGQLHAAAERKQQTYGCLEEALSYYVEQGWVVHVFPWVVGIRGIIDPLHIESLLKFLDIQRKHWKTVIERTVLASVRALYFLHKVRFGGLAEAISPDLDSESSAPVSHAREVAVGTKRKTHRQDGRAAQEYADSDSSTTDDQTGDPRPPSRVRRDPISQMMVSAATDRPPIAHNINTMAARRTLPQTRRSPTLLRVSGGIFKRRSEKADKVKARIATAAERDSVLGGSKRHPRACVQQRLKRKRDGLAEAGIFDTDDPDQRPTKQHRHVPDEYPDTTALWTRWRKMEPRQRRRT